MFKAEFNGKVSFVDNSDGLKIIGTNTESGNSIQDDYNSISYSINTNLNNKYFPYFKSNYRLEILPLSEDKSLEYTLVKIDGINVDAGYVSYLFKSSYSENVTNTENRIISIIIKDNNPIIEHLQYNNKYSLSFTIEDKN